MDCLECGGTYTEKSGTYSLVDPYVGEIIVEGVSYYRCDKCGDILFSVEMAQAIESERNKRIHEILNQFPIGDFISAAETASMLGISRQALHKNKRINHGFIYQTKSGPTTFYLKQSVQKYKEFGDGRFPLHAHKHTPSTEYMEHIIPHKVSVVYEVPKMTIKPMRQLFEQKLVRLKEYDYAS
jgi:hypothetical protein